MKFKGKKKVGIVSSGSNLLGQYPKEAQEQVKEHFEKKNVNLHFNTRFNENSELAKEYDFIINCVGTKILTPFMDKNFKDFKNESGKIFVNKYYQISNVDPLSGSNSGNEKVYENIFAFGDCCLTSLNEPKNVPATIFAALIVSNNLLKSLENSKSEFKTVPEQNFFLSGVYFDDTAGTFVMGDKVNANPNLFADKAGYEIPYFTVLRNDKDGQKNYDEYLANFTG